MSNSPKTMTATVLRNAYSVIRKTTRDQVTYFSRVYGSYCIDHGADIGDVCAYMTGSRIIPRAIIRYYADIDSPRCPWMLYNDIHTSLSDSPGITSAILTKLYRSLCDYISTLPPRDAAELIQETQESMLIADNVARLWTTVLWYTMCCDHAIAAHT